jgi:transketolase
MRKAFAESVIKLAEKDDKTVVLIGDISHYLLREYEERFPERFYNVGICEQTIMSLAAGMAMDGMRPIVHTIAPFCVERAYEQIKVDLCYQNLDVTIVSVGGSFDYSHLGCTHHCYEDVSILRPLPNMEIFLPGTKKEFQNILSASWANGRPKYFKLTVNQHSHNISVKPYECAVVQGGLKGAPVVFVNGHLLDRVLKAPEVAGCTVVYMPTISPLSDKGVATIINSIEKGLATDALVVEENSEIGGLADQIIHIISSAKIYCRVEKLGIPNRFLEEYGTAEEHRERLGLTVTNINERIGELKR